MEIGELSDIVRKKIRPNIFQKMSHHFGCASFVFWENPQEMKMRKMRFDGSHLDYVGFIQTGYCQICLRYFKREVKIE